MSDACCAPGGRDGAAPEEHAPDRHATVAGAAPSSMVDIPAGTFRMGDESVWAYPADGEGPVHDVELDGVPHRRPRRHERSSSPQFVDATGHVTDAERFGWSFVFGGLLPDDFPRHRGVAHAPWWRQVYGRDVAPSRGPALRRRPTAATTRSSTCRGTTPRRTAAWTGTRLPTEAEWEYAARGGRAGSSFPWGDELEPDGEHRMNVFQGTFPGENTGADGFVGTAPVDAFPPNGFGLHNVTGNVWEWCADWFDPGYYRAAPGARSGRARRRHAPGACAAARTSATSRTAAATGWPRGSGASPTAPPATSASASPLRPCTP